MKILLSIIIGVFITAPIFISILIYNRKKKMNWIYGGAFLTLIATFIIFLTFLEIRIPSNNFNENEFRQKFTNVFQIELPGSVEILKKEYKKDGGLFGT
jgi:hypothetical protein